MFIFLDTFIIYECYECTYNAHSKTLSLSKKGLHNRDSFFFFQIVPLNINTFGPAMFKHCNPLTAEDCIMVPPPPPTPPCSSTARIVSKLTTGKV